MAEARLDLAYRDYCAHLLIPLNRCRRRTVSAHFSLFDVYLSPWWWFQLLWLSASNDLCCLSCCSLWWWQFYTPWNCQHERHTYEACQHKECKYFLIFPNVFPVAKRFKLTFVYVCFLWYSILTDLLRENLKGASQ
jgi:NADH dehydrogenase (ubiquinone) 1 beta subcomplex subunit 7